MESGTRGPRVHGTVRGQNATRQEIWIRPSVRPVVASLTEGSESGKEQDGGLGAMSASDVSVEFSPHTFRATAIHFDLLFLHKGQGCLILLT